MNDCQVADGFSEAVFDIWKEVDRQSSLRVSGSSMYPLIRDGDTVIIRHTDKDIKPGSLVAFKKDRRIIVHRVLRCYTVCGEPVYVNRGDHNRHIDSRVRQRAILGRVVAVRRNKRERYLTNAYWSLVGNGIVGSVLLLRLMPARVQRLKVLHILGRVLLRILVFP